MAIENNIDRGMKAAFRAIKSTTAERSAEGKQVAAGEVAYIFGQASRYLNDSQQLGFQDKAKLALKIMADGNVTKAGVQAILHQLDLNPPTDPVIDPTPDPIVVRPRYGLHAVAQPIVDRLNASNGNADPEDIARAQILSRLASMSSAPAVRGRAFATRSMTASSRSAGGELAAMGATIDAAIRNASR